LLSNSTPLTTSNTAHSATAEPHSTLLSVYKANRVFLSLLQLFLKPPGSYSSLSHTPLSSAFPSTATHSTAPKITTAPQKATLLAGYRGFTPFLVGFRGITVFGDFGGIWLLILSSFAFLRSVGLREFTRGFDIFWLGLIQRLFFHLLDPGSCFLSLLPSFLDR
jgi:hypothetical protein